MQIYYGSNVIVNQPKIITDGFYKDFEQPIGLNLSQYQIEIEGIV